MIFRVLVLSVFLIIGAKSQDNAGSSVAKALLECYNKTENLDRELRPPSSINVLIELIRRIESGPSIQNDREISIELIHRFKQDGIIRHLTATGTPYSVPYTPKGMQSDKHKILLTKLIPGSAVNFPDEALTEVERCSLHFMLSNSIDARKRDGESQVCNKLDRFQRRIRRDVDPNQDVEIIDTGSPTQSKGNLQEDEQQEHELDTVNEQEETDVFQEPRTNSRQTVTLTFSDCPVENGAVYTRWGTVQAGVVISGIAAAREPQNIKVQENYVVNGIYASTLVGDLSEVALHQGAGGKDAFVVGAKGGWNGTQAPRWYFINKIINNEMTDAEIRGGLDGLIIAKNVKDWKQKFSNLKVSQVLDMYYSSRGVFSNKNFRACNRNRIFTEVAPQKDLTEQTIANSFLLNEEAKLPGSLTSEGIKAYSEKAVDALINYIAELHDLPCDNDPIERVSTDILIVVDCEWDYSILSRALAYLLDNLDVNKYASSFSVIDGKEGGYLVNSSNSILDFYAKLNRTVYFQTKGGFDVSKAFNAIETISRRKLDENKADRIAGGQSSIVLFVPHSVLNEADKSTANSRKQALKQTFPDLKLLVLGRNSKESYDALVVDSNSDVFVLSDTSTDGAAITDSVNSVISRTKEIHRRIVNPNCDSTWNGGSSSETLEQFVEPSTVNYYRILPNYFYGEGSRTIKVRGYAYGNLAVCMSKQKERPSKNSTDGDDRCETVSSNEVSFPLTDMCKGYSDAYSCPPVYISVEAVEVGESRFTKCLDNGCRFPDNIKYTIQAENLNCYGSGSYRIIGNAFVLLVTYSIVKLFF
ncbi:hypothetical protein ILUMI_21163 [Ignelater luminosus]|uniref:Uncharacterized protein n=1 Tax=Ignelater luminosus TaxID=2038154 RepID=A0A8K0CF16_IGNLU|nr:hypothetical protein ILUMI_21163 [Ignelater luminosus]